jgi:hypothetical protein
MGEGGVERTKYSVENRFRVVKYLVVPKSQHSEPFCSQLQITLAVIWLALCVLSAIELDYQLRLETGEIRDEARNGHLPPEPIAVDASAPQPKPQVTLGIRRLSSQCACTLL